jgi:hypothetical protein
MARLDRVSPDERLDKFAELVSRDIPIPEICQRMSIGKGAGYALMGKLRSMYGEQNHG